MLKNGKGREVLPVFFCVTFCGVYLYVADLNHVVVIPAKAGIQG